MVRFPQGADHSFSGALLPQPEDWSYLTTGTVCGAALGVGVGGATKALLEWSTARHIVIV
jgi:hypothetical protein